MVPKYVELMLSLIILFSAFQSKFDIFSRVSTADWYVMCMSRRQPLTVDEILFN